MSEQYPQMELPIMPASISNVQEYFDVSNEEALILWEEMMIEWRGELDG